MAVGLRFCLGRDKIFKGRDLTLRGPAGGPGLGEKKIGGGILKFEVATD